MRGDDIEEFRFDREYISRHISGIQVPTIPVGEIILSSKCHNACNFCLANARGNGPMMPIELLEQLLQSPQTTFEQFGENRSVYLGDADILLHPELLEAVKQILVKDSGIKIRITTEGLTEQNKETGSRFLRSIWQLPDARQRLTATLTFSILSLHIPLDEYIRNMTRTLTLLYCGFGKLRVHLLHDGTNKRETWKAFKKLDMQFFEGVGIIERKIVPIANAAANYPHLQKGAETSIEMCEILKSPNRTMPTYSIKPDGEVLPYCGNRTLSGDHLGSVFENDARQIHEAYSRFIIDHMKQHRSRPKGMCMCEHHRIRPYKDYSASKSANPIVRRKAKA